VIVRVDPDSRESSFLGLTGVTAAADDVEEDKEEAKTLNFLRFVVWGKTGLVSERVNRW
jgi:hypothetical protein